MYMDSCFCYAYACFNLDAMIDKIQTTALIVFIANLAFICIISVIATSRGLKPTNEKTPLKIITSLTFWLSAFVYVISKIARVWQ